MASSPAVGSGTSTVPTSASAFAAELVTASHVLTIEGYSHISGVARQEFYTLGTFAAAGHRWSVVFYPSGGESSESDWVSIYLRLDQTRATDVKARYKFSLLTTSGQPFPSSSQASTCIHTFTRGVQKGFHRFVKKAAVESYAGHRDDSIRVRCDITVVNLKETNKDDATAKFAIVVPPPVMQHHLGHLLLTGEGADVKLDVDGETFLAHRNILAARSPVFRAQLFGHMEENTEVSMGIEGIEARVFKAFLYFVYNDSLPEIEDREVMAVAQHLLVAADRYSMERLKLICEDKLCNYIGTSSVGTILALAEQHGCWGLKKACLEFVMSGSNLKAAVKTKGFDHLAKSCPSVLKELLAKVAP